MYSLLQDFMVDVDAFEVIKRTLSGKSHIGHVTTFYRRIVSGLSLSTLNKVSWW